ncbi:winged helix-turn-helix transcriptional regulator [Streptomyces goshikiensis]|uniref:winged helix-turn-helix transcriptional regulator n=1 Tax=Streptomyces goshikiensis TaxID=1942 RepID=UPI0036ABE918
MHTYGALAGHLSPGGVEYSLTHLGESLREPFGRLYDWTVNHAEEIRAHQRDYDQRTGI